MDIWDSSGAADPSRGLIFGLSNAITDQHVFEYGRLGRSTNVAFSTGLPIVGMDAATGGVITDESTLSDITGYTASVIVDPGHVRRDRRLRRPERHPRRAEDGGPPPAAGRLCL